MADDRRRTYTLFAIVTLACALGSLTQTVMNPMLGGVKESFGTDENVSQWLTTIFMLTIGITVPLVVHLSRRFTIRTLTLISLGISFAGGIMAVLSPNFAILIISRVLQAVGAGITLPILQTIAMTRFPKGQNATAMGIAGIAMGFAPNIGPLIGGALVDTTGWRSFFWIYIAVCAILFACTLVFVRRNPHDATSAHLDFLSFMLSTLGFGGLLLSFSNAAGASPISGAVIIPLIIGVICLVWFILRQRRIEFPLVSMEIFHSRTYAISFVAQNLLFGSYMGITLILPLFVMNICQATPVEAGMVFLPTTILAIVFNPLAGILSDKVGARVVIVVAAVFLSVGAVSMIFISAQTPLWLITLMQVIRGIGVSSLIGPLNSWGMHRLAMKNMIDGSAFATTVRQACASLCTALMMIAATGAFFSGAASQAGYQIAFAFSAVLAVAVLACAIFFVRDQRS